MMEHEKVDILLVDDQPAKLLSYEAILSDLGENLLKASSGREALEQLLKTNVAVVLVDVCMPDLDGFQLAAMIREHPRFQKTAIIFVSAIHLSDLDRMRGYEMGAVDYVPVPVIPDVLRAKVKIFAELYRKTRELERLNSELEARVMLRTAELQASTARLQQSEQRRSLALIAGNMGSWDWDYINGNGMWDDGQYRIFGVDKENFTITADSVLGLLHPEDREPLLQTLERMVDSRQSCQAEFRVRRPNGEERWCLATASPSTDAGGRIVRVSGVTVDITDRRQTEERQSLLAREIDHRAKNALALVQSIVRLTRANSIATYVSSVEGRISALSRVHTLLSQSRWQNVELRGLVEEEIAPYRSHEPDKIIVNGSRILLEPAAAQTVALALHELVTNAVKYGALSSVAGRVMLNWELNADTLKLHWTESGGPAVKPPGTQGFGAKIIVGSIEKQIGGKVQFDWRPEGLQCLLSIPRNEQIKPLDRTRQPNQISMKDNVPFQPGSMLSATRILVVEDETLVAMVISEYLSDMGFSIVGPCSTLEQAMAAVDKSDFDAAILDVNLAGVMVYPLADALLSVGIPFIFVTGYGATGIDARYEKVPVLQKPINAQEFQRLFRTSKDVSNVVELHSSEKLTA